MLSLILPSLLLLMLPTAAAAFPITEGTSTASALLGGVGTLLAGAMARMGRDRKGASHLVASVFLGMFGIMAAAGWWLETHESEVMLLDARLSVPGGDLDSSVKTGKLPAPPSAEDVAWAQEKDLFVDLDAFWSGEVAGGAVIAYLDADESAKYQPYGVHRFVSGNLDRLAGFAWQQSSPILLVSDFAGETIKAARHLEALGVKGVRGLWLGPDPFGIAGGAEDLPLYSDTQGIFDQHVVDIREKSMLRWEHNVLHHATHLPLYDILLMRDEEIRGRLSWPVVFTNNSTDGYAAIDRRLKRAGLRPGEDYSFYEGGLLRHFDDLGRGKGAVPYHYNLRLADPQRLMDVALATGRLRFVCTSAAPCRVNIPDEMRVDIDFDALGRDEARARIEALDKKMLYAVTSSDQLSASRAMMTGWWLVSSGHNFLGELVMPQRFPVKRLYEEKVGAAGAFDHGWARSLGVASLDLLSDGVRQCGWVAVFAALGLSLRMAVLAARASLGRIMPRGAVREWTMIGVSLLSLAGLVLAYLWLERAISYYAVVPHEVMQDLMLSGWAWLDELVLVLVVANAALLGWGRWIQISAVAGIMGLLWVMDVLDGIPDPLAVLLLAGEAASLLVMGLRLVRPVRARRMARKGIYIDSGMAGVDLPEKWALTTSFRPTKGFLCDLEAGDMQAILREALRIRSPRLILRSASARREEQSLGGFHRSRIVGADAAEVKAGLDALKGEGCEFAWIQPYLRPDEAVVIASIGPDGARGAMLAGEADAATEGRRDARSLSLEDPQTRKSNRAYWKLLRDAERHVSGPVLLEAGMRNGRVQIYQLRHQRPATSPEASLYPTGLAGFHLAQEYIARCSRLTGSALASVTHGDFIFINGFLYRRNRSRVAGQVVTRGSVARVEARLWEIFGDVHAGADATLAIKLKRLEDAIGLYRDIYRMSQSTLRPSKVETGISRELQSGEGQPELEIAGRKHLHAEHKGGRTMRPTRDALHDMAVVITAVVSRIVADIEGTEGADGGLHIETLRDPDFSPMPDIITDKPLGQMSRDIIHPGEISGKIWMADRAGKPQQGEGYVLAGEEIGSEWSRHLHLFTGIVSVYGDANAHIGLSARTLGIPYRKISKGELERLSDRGVIRIPEDGEKRDHG